MRTETIIKAINLLDKAGHALRMGDLDITAQVRLASECTTIAFTLQHELEKAVPEVKIAA